MDQLNGLPNASCILIVTMIVLAAAIVHLMAKPEAQAQYAFLEQAP